MGLSGIDTPPESTRAVLSDTSERESAIREGPVGDGSAALSLVRLNDKEVFADVFIDLCRQGV